MHKTLLIILIVLGTQVSAFEKIKGTSGSDLYAKAVAQFSYPWAMTFITEDFLLITTKPGKLWLVTKDGKKRQVTGVPKPFVIGQGGLGDVVAHPSFKNNQFVYLSLVQSADNGVTKSAVVMRGKLLLSESPTLTELETIWTQMPAKRGSGHFSQKIAFGPMGSDHEGKLFITSGDRQAKIVSQQWDMALGKIIRLNDDGSLPADNPFQDKGELAKSFWTLGHRNALGIAFDANNKLWANEMGPKHGDELNLIERGQNYGWPIVSNGNHYDGTAIPAHNTRPEFTAPKAYWVPTIAPSGLVIYSGKHFLNWQGDAFMGGLKSRALIRVGIDGNMAKEAERFEWGMRIREVEEGPDGLLWVLEDDTNGRLIKLKGLDR